MPAAFIMPTGLLTAFLCMSVVQAQAAGEVVKNPPAGYIPKVWPAVIAVALFGGVAAVHWYHRRLHGTPYMNTLAIGMTGMTVGYLLRIGVTQTPYTLGLFAIEEVFILLSPCLFLAADYILLSKLADHFGEEVHRHALFLPKSFIVRGFVVSDAVTFLLQAAGSGMTSVESLAVIGKNIALAGLIIQFCSFFLFCLLFGMFLFRIRRDFPRLWQRGGSRSVIAAWSRPASAIEELDWRILASTMALTCVGIVLRSLFRIIDFAQGWNGYLRLHEGFLYLLDSFPLWVAMTLYAFVWPPLYMLAGGTSHVALEQKA